MKKIFIYFLFSLSFLVLPFSAVFANTTQTSTTSNCEVSFSVGSKSTSDFLQKMKDCANGTSGVGISDMKQENSVTGLASQIEKLASGFMRYGALFAVGAIVISGIMYTTAYGDDAKLSRAKKIAIFALVWLLLALASYSLVNAVIYIIYGAIW